MNKSTSSFFLSFGLLATLSAIPISAHATFASVQSTGIAGASVAYPIDSLAAAYNPGGISDVGNRADVEIAWIQNWGSAGIAGNTTADANGNYDGMHEKAFFPIGLGFNFVWCLSEDWKIAVGAVGYTNRYQKTTYKKVMPVFGTSKMSLEYLNETVSPVLAVQWCDSHSIGISIDFQAQRLKIRGLENLQNYSIYPDDVTNHDYNYSTAWSYTVGYCGHLTDELMIGITYRPKTPMPRLKKYKGFFAEQGRFDIPTKLSFGFSYRIIPCLVFAFDAEKLYWSQIKALNNSFTNSQDTLNRFGASNGPGFGWRDQWIYRFGIEWEFNELCTVRAGYIHSPSPIRESQTFINMLTLDTVEDYITVGGTWYVDNCIELSLCGVYGFENDIHGKGVIPEALGGGNVSLKEQKFAVGIAFGYKF